MQDFYEYTYKHLIAPSLVPNAMVIDEPEYDELFDLFDRDDLPLHTLSAEMADGYMTACAIGPHEPPMFEWLSEVFAQDTLPICGDLVAQERMLQLLRLRMSDIRRRIDMPRDQSTTENIFFPLRSDLEPGDLIVPYTFDSDGHRNGRWQLKEWANGFRMRIFIDKQWQPLFDDPEYRLSLAALLLYDQGHNPDNPSVHIEDEPNLLSSLVATLHHMNEFWTNWRATHPLDVYRQSGLQDIKLPYLRHDPKVGRNDPCSCGSGIKYKRCCGA